MANKVPEELLEFNNWVAWELRKNPSNPAKPKKMPINPNTGSNASVKDASTWGDYQGAIQRAEMIHGGIGFMFGEPGKPCGIAGIDLDDCVDGDDEGHVFLTPEATEIVKLMDSYTEYSPSGQGLHILFRLSRSLHDIEPSIKTGRKNDKQGIEIYDSGRYLTFTGYVYGEPKAIADRTEQAQAVLEKYFAPASLPPTVNSQSMFFNAPETDSELWEKMFNFQNGTGARIRRLYQGDISDYSSWSQADMALCCYLAYATNKDYARIDSMFRQSGLMRPKWDEMHGNQTYGQMTISKAIAMTPDYIPEVHTQRIGDKAGQVSAPKQEAQPEIKFSFNAEYVDSGFEQDMRLFQRYSGRKTGFINLDGKLTLYPALYVVGAISSLGKSTFCLQLADQLAEAGEHVLFFAFEQTRFELVSKSLARMCQSGEYLIASSPTAIQIRDGRTSPELREAMQKYKEIMKHEAIIECNFMTDITTLTRTVEAYIKTYGVKPVVFVDYLQLIRAGNPKLTNTKDIVDENIRALKLLQMKNELVMFVVSSINRENYLTTIDFQSFKESGSIEFTADVVMGLQLAIMNNKLFETDTKTTKKRKAVKAAKAETPRRLELCILKNRYGVSSESFFFDYYPKFDYFIPADFEATKEAVLRLINSIPEEDKKKAK